MESSGAVRGAGDVGGLYTGRARTALRRLGRGRPARHSLLPGAQHVPRAVRGGRRRAGARVPSSSPRLPATARLGHEEARRRSLVPPLRSPALTRFLGTEPYTEIQRRGLT